jgi:hypothetical protein
LQLHEFHAQQKKIFEAMAPVFWDMTLHKLMSTLKKEAALSCSTLVPIYRIRSRNNLKSLLGTHISFKRAIGRKEVNQPFFRQMKGRSFTLAMACG